MALHSCAAQMWPMCEKRMGHIPLKVNVSLPRLNDTELNTLRAHHSQVTLPDPEHPGLVIVYCHACGNVMPCPTLRLVDEVKELRVTEQRYGESLHDEDRLRMHGGKRIC